MEDRQLCSEFVKTVEVNAHEISALLVLADNQVVLADRKTTTVMLFNGEFEKTDEMQYTNRDASYWGIKHMCDVTEKNFALLMPGFWYGSDVRFLTTEDGKLQYLRSLTIDVRCFGICFQKGFMFATFSPLYGAQGYVKMIDQETGIEKHTFKCDEHNPELFSNRLSKIYVDETFRMFVCDKRKKELIILKVDPFSYKATTLTSHKYQIRDIALRKDGSSFLSTTSDDGVVLLHATGTWVFNNFLSKTRLEGAPTAVAFWEGRQQLLVAVQMKGVFKKTLSSVLVYKISHVGVNDQVASAEN